MSTFSACTLMPPKLRVVAEREACRRRRATWSRVDQLDVLHLDPVAAVLDRRPELPGARLPFDALGAQRQRSAGAAPGDRDGRSRCRSRRARACRSVSARGLLRLPARRRLRQVRLELQRLVRVRRRRRQRIDLDAADLDERAGRSAPAPARGRTSRSGTVTVYVLFRSSALLSWYPRFEPSSVPSIFRDEALPVSVPSRIAEPAEARLIGQLPEVREVRRGDVILQVRLPRSDRARSVPTPGPRCRAPSPSPAAACRGGSRTAPGCRRVSIFRPAISLLVERDPPVGGDRVGRDRRGQVGDAEATRSTVATDVPLVSRVGRDPRPGSKSWNSPFARPFSAVVRQVRLVRHARQRAAEHLASRSPCRSRRRCMRLGGRAAALHVERRVDAAVVLRLVERDDLETPRRPSAGSGRGLRRAPA